MDSLKISLIIPAYNEEKYIADCLDYVERSSKGRLFEVIVVDNASTDRTGEVAGKRPWVRVVPESWKGLTRARQRGFQEAKGDILAFIDADTRMPPEWLPMLIHEFEKHGDLAALSGPYIYYDLPQWKQFLVKLYWYILALPAYWIVGYMTIGGNFAIRRSVLERMEGFDTNIEFYGEDTNIARRASRFGKARFSPRFAMYTSGRRLSGQGILATAWIYVTNFVSEVFFLKPATKEYKDIR